MNNKILNTAIVGYGYWGPNLARNFSMHKNCVVTYICDHSKTAQERASKFFPHSIITNSFNEILEDPSLDVVVVCTPVKTHFELCLKALQHNKHVFVEKPLTSSAAEARILQHEAKTRGLVLGVDHTFLHTGSIKKIKEIVDSGEIGKPLFFDSTRINLGLFQPDIDVLWDLAPHDLSILRYLFGIDPVHVDAIGVDHFNTGLANICYLRLKYGGDLIANLHLNWISPVKIRKIIIGGTKKMIVYDDMESHEKVKIYDKAVLITNEEDRRNALIKYRIGDTYSPSIDNTEALVSIVESFVSGIVHGTKLSGFSSEDGVAIVEILEKASQSLKQD